MKKAQAKAKANPESSIVFQDNTAPTTPQKQELELVEPTPISRAAAPDRLVNPPAKPARKPATKPAKTIAAKPAPAAKPVPVTYTTTVTKAPAKRTPTRKPSRKIERQQAAAPTPAPQSDLSPCTLTFKATDRSGNQRTGHGVVNVSETTELEKQAARQVQAIRELELAGQQLRNPYGN